MSTRRGWGKIRSGGCSRLGIEGEGVVLGSVALDCVGVGYRHVVGSGVLKPG